MNFWSELAETIIEARRRRAEIFNPAMFGETQRGSCT